MAKFSPRDPAHLLQLIEAYPLAWIVAARDAGFSTAVMPMLAETGGSGELASLFGHLPRHHPMTTTLRGVPRALILFQGPNAYVSPSLVGRPDWAPTWNFTAAAFTVDVEFVPDETDAALDDLVTLMEHGPEPWTTAAMGPRYADLAARVVAFRAHIRAHDIRFKHGQDETPAEFAAIVAGLDDRTLAQWMVATRG